MFTASDKRSEDWTTFVPEAVSFHDDIEQRGFGVEIKLAHFCICKQILDFGSWQLAKLTSRATIQSIAASHCRRQTLLCTSVEKIHSVGTINNVETSYFTQLKICYLTTTPLYKYLLHWQHFNGHVTLGHGQQIYCVKSKLVSKRFTYCQCLLRISGVRGWDKLDGESESWDDVQKLEVTAIREYVQAGSSVSLGLKHRKHDIRMIGYVAE